MRTTITDAERLQLLGLITLGQKHYRMVDEIRDNISEILEDEDKDSRLTDATWDYPNSDIDELLKIMGIEVIDGKN